MRKIYRKTVHDSMWREIESPAVGCWQFFVAPTQSELEEIANLSRISLETVAGSFDDPFEFPRIERENGSVFLVFRIPLREGARVITEPVVFIVTETTIISLVRVEHDFIQRLLRDQKLVSTQKTNFLLQVLLQVIGRYQHYLREINKSVLNKKVSIRALSDEDIVSLVELEETLTNFNSALVPLIGVLHNISLGKVVQLFEKDKELVEELMTSGQQILEWCKVNIKSTVNIREAHSTILTNKLNKTIKLLTSITIIVTIPNIIAGMFGMNLALPFVSHSYAFGIVLLLMAFFILLAFAVFWKKRWL